MKTIYEFIKKARDDYRSETVEITEGLEFSQYDTLRAIEFYHSSKFTTGQTDGLGREKPFYNICKFRVNVATRATDLDTKDVQIQAEGAGSYAQSFLLTLKNRNWMKASGFPQFLNKMGHTRAKYGGVMVKKTEHKGQLRVHVVPWRDLITDIVDMRGAKIERHYYSPAELKDMEGTWRNIDEAIRTAKPKKTADASIEGGKENRTLGANIEVWEVHGVLPKLYLDAAKSEEEGEGTEAPQIDSEAPTEYERQMHIVVLDESDKNNIKGVTLFAGREKEDPYKYLAWEEIDGRGLGVGVIEDLFEAQVWTNYSEKQKKDMLDLAGKILFQSADQNIAAKNVLTDLENGAILSHAPNMPVTQVNNTPGSFAAFEKLVADWDQQAERVTSTFAAKTGENLPSGTPFRLGAVLNQEAGSMFVYRLQEAGLFIQEIYQDWILPFLVKQIMNEKELVADLTDEELQTLAEDIAQHEAVKHIKEQILSGNLVSREEFDAIKQAVMDAHRKGPKRRAFKIPKDFFQDDYNVDVVTTGEQKNKAVMLETLFNLFQVVAKTPQLLQDPILRKLFNQIVEMSGVSPLMFKTPDLSPQGATPGPDAPQLGNEQMPTNIVPQMPAV